jgi:hypothetical protein
MRKLYNSKFFQSGNAEIITESVSMDDVDDEHQVTNLISTPADTNFVESLPTSSLAADTVILLHFYN